MYIRLTSLVGSRALFCTVLGLLVLVVTLYSLLSLRSLLVTILGVGLGVRRLPKGSLLYSFKVGVLLSSSLLGRASWVGCYPIGILSLCSVLLLISLSVLSTLLLKITSSLSSLISSLIILEYRACLISSFK